MSALPVVGAATPPLVVVLVPTTETADPSLEYYHDYSQSHQEFARAFDALDLTWRWQPVTTATFRGVLDTLARELPTLPLIVFNLCDGDDSNDVPGIEVIDHLESLGLPYTGADARFYRGTTSKIDMKRAFDAAGVATAVWEEIGSEPEDAGALLGRLGVPVIVKPAVAAGSMGIGLRSVVSEPEALRAQARRLHEGYRGWNLVSGGILAERFIAGREFTVFIVGDGHDPQQATIYPPVEREFHSALPAVERFLSYDRLWEVHEQESPIGAGEHLWEYQPVPTTLGDRIKALGWAAYVAVGGRGYGRVDLRMDEGGTLWVLEVNAQCGLSEDEDYTSIGAILRVAGRPFAGLVRDILANATGRHEAAARGANR